MSLDVGSSAQNLPVFVFPTQLVFVAQEAASHKQVLTLYNPYEFPISFRVLCTAPLNYSVVEPEGVIRPKCSVDIVVRHQAVNRSPSTKTDVFRINIHEQGNRQVKGCKDVPSSLEESSSRDTTAPLSSSQFSGTSGRNRSDSTRSRHLSVHENVIGGRSHSLMVVAGIVCIVALSLPTQSEKSIDSTIPTYLHLTVPQKLVAAYALGLITALIFRLR